MLLRLIACWLINITLAYLLACLYSLSWDLRDWPFNCRSTVVIIETVVTIILWILACIVAMPEPRDIEDSDPDETPFIIN